MLYDELYEVSRRHARHVIWVLSDLQQSKFENCEKCLRTCANDYEALGKPAEMIFYLGDSTEGRNMEQLQRMCNLQEAYFTSLQIPLCYATGNHDYDYAEWMHQQGSSTFSMPFYEMVQRHPNFHTTKSCEDTWFTVELDKDYIVYFFTDHIAKDNSWCSTHNHFRFGAENYPYTDEHFAAIRRAMEADPHKYILTASHYAFPGGNRDTFLLSKIQPLPTNVRLHLYGHSHVGEYKCPRERVFSSIQWVDWQDIPQVDVASFEDIRGSYCKSVILHLYEDGSAGLFFRNHNEGRFVQALFTKNSSAEKTGDFYEKRALFGK